MAHDDELGFDVTVLGTIAVRSPEGLLDPGSRKPRLVLALLLTEAGEVVSFERLIDGLWGEEPPATARKTLQVHVASIRRGLGPSFPLRTAPSGYVLDTERLTIDAVRFEVEVDEGSSLRATAPAEASSLLSSALGRWAGQPYADVADADALRAEVTRLNELRLYAVEQRIEADLQLGRHDRVLGELETLTADHPYRERFRMLHMLALYRGGRQAEALRAYDRTRRTLGDELGLDPGPELRGLHQQILEQSAELDLDTTMLEEPVIARGVDDECAVAGGDATGTIRGYELREKLGDRAHSTVYRAYQASVGREVALKVIGADLANRPEFVKRFDSECQLLAELEHPHVVTLLDYWRDPGGAYLAMSLLQGGTVARALAWGPWRPPAALRMLDQIGSALSHAHRRGVVHGDLRPTNVLLDEDGNAYLSDFVLAGDVGTAWSPTEHSRASPEQISGAEITPATDIHALGLLTHEVLTGCEPSPGERPEPTVYMPLDLPATFDEVIAQATDPDPHRRFDRVESFLRALRRAFGADVVTSEVEMIDAAIRNPYKGLRAFGETDADDFFGRDDLLEELVARVRTTNLTVVIGPSGSGKSSLVRAGLIPTLRRDGLAEGRDVVVAEMFPGSYPFEELASALLRVAVDRPAELLADLSADDRGLMRVSKQILPDDNTDLVLVIDQLEELFALTREEAVRSDFLANLVTVATDERSRVRVVATLRADFFDRPLNSPKFGELMKTSMTTVARMDDSSVAEAIALPARRVGLEIEPGLIPTILRDVAEEPGALPMLQYALTELADTRDGQMLTIAGYERTGGVIGALATRAEEIYDDLPPAGQDAAQELFVRLVNVNDDADDTRRRVRRTELEALGVDPQSLASVIDTYGSFRLLSFDRDPVTRGPTVEVAHEALIREWPRYRRWIDARRDDLRTERRLQHSVAEWTQGDRDPSFLIAGGRLERYEQWATSTRVRLTEDEKTFLDESRRTERERADAESRRRRRVLLGVSALALLALVLASVAVVQRNRADDEAADAVRLRTEAERAAAVDAAAALVSRTKDLGDPDLELLLALEAHDSLEGVDGDDALVASALLQSAYDHRIENRFPPIDVEGAGSVPSPNADGTKVVQMDLDEAVVYDTTTGEVAFEIAPPERLVGATWDVDDDVILVGTREGSIDVWSPEGVQVGSFDVSDTWPFPVSMDGDRLVYTEAAVRGPTTVGRFVVHDTATEERLFESVPILAGSEPGLRHVAVVDTEFRLRVHRRDTWGEVAVFDLGWESADDVPDVDLVDGADELWVLGDGRISRHDILTLDELASFSIDVPNAWELHPSPDGELVIVSGPGPMAQILDAKTGEEVGRLVVPHRPPFDPVWAPSGRRLLTFSDVETIVWDLGPPNAAAAVWPGLDFVPAVVAELASGDLFFGSADGGGEIFDAVGANQRHTFEARGAPGVPPLVSADGSTILLPNPGGIEIYDVAAGSLRATGPSEFPRPLGVSADGTSLVVATDREPADDQYRVAFLDGGSGELTARIGSLIDAERAAFTSDGSMAVVPIERIERNPAADPNSGLWVVDVESGDAIAKGPPQRCITSVAISTDGERLVSGGCDGNVSLFDMRTLTESDQPWTSHLAGVTTNDVPVVGISFAAGDAQVIVTREDGRVESFSTDVDGAADTRLGRGAELDAAWWLDVGAAVGIPEVRGPMVWLGAQDPLTIDAAGNGGAIGVPLESDDVATFARSTVSRQLDDSECREYLGLESCSER